MSNYRSDMDIITDANQFSYKSIAETWIRDLHTATACLFDAMKIECLRSEISSWLVHHGKISREKEETCPALESNQDLQRGIR